MNDWYIDRSKNYVNSSLDPVLSFLNKYDGELKSNVLIQAFIENNIFDGEAGNLNAALTRFRDHGFITNDNKIGDSSIDYIEGRIAKDDLIIDLLLKRPALKKNSPNLKPFVLLCIVFDYMYELSADIEEVYLTFEECYHFLYEIDSYEEVTLEYVDDILSNRMIGNNLPTLKSNEITNLSIWTNALRSTPVFVFSNNRTIIQPNYYSKSFINYVAMNARMISETPTDSNTNLYNYYCNRNMGLNEIIEDVFIPNVVVNNIFEAKCLYNYIMGIKIEPDFQYLNYVKKESFGIYNAFMYMPKLFIRKVWMNNKKLGESLYSVIG